MVSPALEDLFSAIQEAAAAPLWTRGVNTARTRAVQLDGRKGDEELLFRLRIPGQLVSPRVSLWPAEGDWHCDCGAREDPCHHVVAAAVAMKNDWLAPAMAEDAASSSPKLQYHFSRAGGGLAAERRIVGGAAGAGQPLAGSLIAYVSGLSAGRVQGPVVAVTKSDYSADDLLTRRKSSGPLTADECQRLFTVLREGASLFLEGRPSTPEELLALGRELASDGGPAAQTVAAPRPGQVRGLKPYAVVETRREADGRVVVLPRILYGEPAFAQVLATGGVELYRPDIEPERDFAAEKRLVLQMQSDLHGRPGQPLILTEKAAARMAGALAGWSLAGEGWGAFRFAVSFSGIDGAPLTLNLDLGAVDEAWIEANASRLEALLEARISGREGGAAPLPRHLAPEAVDLFASAGAELPESLRGLRERLRDPSTLTDSALRLPADLTAELRPYQRAGVAWLRTMRELGVGALLADDMGLGKTLQALAAVDGPTLVVCPASVLSVWAAEASRHRPGLRVSVYHGADRRLPGESVAGLVLTTYGVLRSDAGGLAARTWDMVILDESQTIRNKNSQVAQAAMLLKGRFKLCLTGTPLENRLDDLITQFAFLNPGLLSANMALDECRRRARPFLLRRLKEQVASDLPPRTEVDVFVDLGEEERALYRSIVAVAKPEALAALERGDGAFSVLEVLLRLRQACSDPRLVPGGAGAAWGADGVERLSSKTELLLERLEVALAEGHRSLVFSQWTSYLDIVEGALRQRGIGFLRLDGGTRDRGAVVQEFQREDGPPVMLLSLKAGGVGLTLTAADHVFLADPWWNPAAERQAADRAHRIGQSRPVIIHRLMAKDTVEERVVALARSKAELARAVLEGRDGEEPAASDDFGASLNLAELRELIESL